MLMLHLLCVASPRPLLLPLTLLLPLPQYVTELKSRIIDLEGHQAVKDSQLRRVQSELEWKNAELNRWEGTPHQAGGMHKQSPCMSPCDVTVRVGLLYS